MSENRVFYRRYFLSNRDRGRICRRRYLKYAGGIVAVAVVAATGYGVYEATKPSVTPAPTATPTLTPSPTTAPTLTTTPTPTPTPTPYSRQETPDFWRGVMFVEWMRENDQYIEPGMRELKKRVPANVISLYVPYYTETPESDKIFPIYDTSQYGTPWHGFQLIESWPPELIEDTMDVAHQIGLRLAYWPNVGPITEGWPWENALDPIPTVFKAYREFKAEQARLAEKHQCECFWIGNEWNRSYTHGESWKRILEAVRDNFSASIVVEFLYPDPGWWEMVLTKVTPTFFELMDYTGLSMNLFPMSPDYWGGPSSEPKDYSPTVPQLIARWQKPAKAIEQAYRKFRKPIIITELSACSYEGAACEDFQFYAEKFTEETAVDFQEQADLIEAAMRVLTTLECVYGVSWNQWLGSMPTHVDDMDTIQLRDMEFQGKPAEKVLKFWYSKRDIRDGVGLLLTPDGHVDLENLQRENPLNEHGK